MNHPFLVSAFLGIAVLVVASGCVGMVRMRSASGRLHFVNATTLLAPLFVLGAVISDGGPSQATIKAVLITLVLLLEGPVLAHIIGRAIYVHERTPPGKPRQ